MSSPLKLNSVYRYKYVSGIWLHSLGGASEQSTHTHTGGDKAKIAPPGSSMAAGAGQTPGDSTKHPTNRQVSGLATAYLVIYNVVLCAG